MSQQGSSHMDPSAEKYFIHVSEKSGREGMGSSSTSAGLKVRTPGHADVLCGRGGGINSHEGNIAFRELVKKEKERYNVAADKFQKAEISHHVIDLVKNRGGRFLAKENDWWVEIDFSKAMAKTSQALREGAPSIRAKAARKKMKLKKKARKVTSSRAASYSPLHGDPGRKVRRRYSSDDSDSQSKSEEEHPLIRGFPNGRRGKILIPVPKQEVEEHPIIRGSPDGHRGKTLVRAHPPTPPLPPTPSVEKRSQGFQRDGAPLPDTASTQVPRFPSQDEIVTPKLLPTPVTAQNNSSSFAHPALPALHPNIDTKEPDNGTGLYPSAFSLPAPINTSPVKCPHPAATTLNVMDPEADYADIVKPDIGCARLHSLAFSEMSCIEDFRGDEAFSNPFENDENGIVTAPPGAINNVTKDHAVASIAPKSNSNSDSNNGGDILRPFYPTTSAATSSDDLSIAKVNAVLKFRSSDSTFSNDKHSISPSSPVVNNTKSNENNNADNSKNNNNGSMNINPVHLKSLRSFMSELSDLREMDMSDDEGAYQDFHEGLRDIYDAVTPGLSTPEEGEEIPMHLTPYSLLRSSSMNQ